MDIFDIILLIDIIFFPIDILRYVDRLMFTECSDTLSDRKGNETAQCARCTGLDSRSMRTDL